MAIADRSHLHDWEIHPHHHADLAQLLYIRRGWAEAGVKGCVHVSKGSHPGGAVAMHSRVSSERVEGHVLTLESRTRAVLATFTRLVERDFYQQSLVEDYAAQLDITPVYLNTLTRHFTGHTAQGVPHQRLLLEAKRQLIDTAMTISQISGQLGFSEPAYFSRLFKRLTEQSPKDFRHHPNGVSSQP